jgi:hypothetical protein
MPPHLRVVPEANRRSVSIDHSERAALMILQLLNVWKETLTGDLSTDQASRIGFHLVSEHLAAVEAGTLSHLAATRVQ